MTLIETPLRSHGDTETSRTDEADGLRARRRAQLFRESPLAVCRRWVLGGLWALRPKRIGNLVPLGQQTISQLFRPRMGLPDPTELDPKAEIAGLVNDLSLANLSEAYRRGLFPHGHLRPLRWVCPHTRGVVPLSEFHISNRLRSLMRQGRYRVTFDQDFEGVLIGCAEPRRRWLNLTWITPRIMRAYATLFDAGLVHSFEVWNKDGALVGGGYGTAVGRVFVIESQFFRESNASKIGLAVLAWHLAKWGFAYADNKWLTAGTAQFGFREMPRGAYLDLLRQSDDEIVRPGRWQAEADSKAVAAWRQAAENPATRPK